MAGPATAANITVNSLEQVLLGRDSFGLAVLLFVTFLDQLRPIVVLLPAQPTGRLDSALCRQETETFPFMTLYDSLWEHSCQAVPWAWNSPCSTSGTSLCYQRLDADRPCGDSDSRSWADRPRGCFSLSARYERGYICCHSTKQLMERPPPKFDP